MAATLSEHIEVLDTHQWELLSMPVTGSITAVGSGYWMAEDLRNNEYNHPIVYFNGSAALQYGYNAMHDSWGQLNTTFGAGGGFGAGNTAVFSPSLSPSGTLAAGGSTTKIVLSTALPSSVGENQLADRGDGKGFIVRVIGKSAGGSGKIEERRCIGNTSGTTPTIIFDPAEPLSFTPAANDGYEFLSGSYLYLGTGALAANQWRRYDCLTAGLSSLVTTNLIATVPATGNFLIATDEGYVPYTRKSGEGYLGTSTYGSDIHLSTLQCLTATGSAATTLTGQAIGGDVAVLINQYRNYQLRIVEDTAIPTAVGQRRRIISHTAGASPVYTISSGATNWTVTPSTTCKFVIENWTDNIIAMIGGTSTVYNYTIANNYTTVNTANQWDTSTWAVKGNTSQTSGSFGWHAFGLVADEINSVKSSNIFLFRGATVTYDLFDIAGAATGSWTQGLTIVDWTGTASIDTISATDCLHVAYNPHTQDGRFTYLTTANSSTTLTYQRPWLRFDSVSRRIEKIAGIPDISGSLGFSAARWAFITLGYLDDGTKLAFYNTARPLSGASYWRLWLTM